MPPPTRAKSAMEEAPIEKPVTTLSAVARLSGKTTLLKSRKRPPRPSSARPTTVMPMTAPPLKATLSALGRLSRAAKVVRTLASVATFMPAQPAAPLATAPTTKAAAMNGLWFSPLMLASASRMATPTTKPASTVYSRLRKAIAPSWMRAAISTISGSPGGCFLTQEALVKANARAAKPATGTATATVNGSTGFNSWSATAERAAPGRAPDGWCGVR